MDEDEIRRAVLFALETARQAHASVTSAVLFSALPKCLRESWSLTYLRRYVLRDLDNAFLISAEPMGNGRVVYDLTPSGRIFLQTG